MASVLFVLLFSVSSNNAQKLETYSKNETVTNSSVELCNGFKCPLSGICIDVALVCDNKIDCPEGEDEPESCRLCIGDVSSMFGGPFEYLTYNTSIDAIIYQNTVNGYYIYPDPVHGRYYIGSTLNDFNTFWRACFLKNETILKIEDCTNWINPLYDMHYDMFVDIGCHNNCHFSCYQTGICLANTSMLCDGSFDCHLKDDETQCDVCIESIGSSDEHLNGRYSYVGFNTQYNGSIYYSGIYYFIPIIEYDQLQSKYFFRYYIYNAYANQLLALCDFGTNFATPTQLPYLTMSPIYCQSWYVYSFPSSQWIRSGISLQPCTTANTATTMPSTSPFTTPYINNTNNLTDCLGDEDDPYYCSVCVGNVLSMFDGPFDYFSYDVDLGGIIYRNAISGFYLYPCRSRYVMGIDFHHCSDESTIVSCGINTNKTTMAVGDCEYWIDAYGNRQNHLFVDIGCAGCHYTCTQSRICINDTTKLCDGSFDCYLKDDETSCTVCIHSEDDVNDFEYLNGEYVFDAFDEVNNGSVYYDGSFHLYPYIGYNEFEAYFYYSYFLHSEYHDMILAGCSVATSDTLLLVRTSNSLECRNFVNNRRFGAHPGWFDWCIKTMDMFANSLNDYIAWKATGYTHRRGRKEVFKNQRLNQLWDAMDSNIVEVKLDDERIEYDTSKVTDQDIWNFLHEASKAMKLDADTLKQMCDNFDRENNH
eukprot:569473_1